MQLSTDVSDHLFQEMQAIQATKLVSGSMKLSKTMSIKCLVFAVASVFGLKVKFITNKAGVIEHKAHLFFI